MKSQKFVNFKRDSNSIWCHSDNIFINELNMFLKSSRLDWSLVHISGLDFLQRKVKLCKLLNKL